MQNFTYRVPVQIAVAEIAEQSAVYVLANDGSLWVRRAADAMIGEPKWWRIPELPQPSDDAS